MSLKVHAIPSDEAIRKEYARLVRNDNLSNSSSTRICGKHFVGEERLARNQLPTIFPWSENIKPRRQIAKHVLEPSKSLKRTAIGEITASIDRTNEDPTCEDAAC